MLNMITLLKLIITLGTYMRRVEPKLAKLEARLVSLHLGLACGSLSSVDTRVIYHKPNLSILRLLSLSWTYLRLGYKRAFYYWI